MFQPTKLYIEHNSPHIRRQRTARMCMWHVIIALMPTTLSAWFFFGLPAILTTVVSIVCCVVTEWLIVKYLMGPGCKAALTAAALTGLLLALNVPSIIPLWCLAIGCVVAIGIGKMAFGGLGCNIFNPALVGRVFLLISFPVAMTTWPVPGTMFVADGSTGATMLSAINEGITIAGVDYGNMLAGNVGGSMGEVASVALLVGLVYLLVMRVITWHIPVAIVATVALFDLCLGVNVGIDMLSGGLLLGAIFMATDYVTSPMTNAGGVVYGIFIGVITVVIRRWGAYPEGMSFAILIMNGFTPLINRYFKPRRFGVRSIKEVLA